MCYLWSLNIEQVNYGQVSNTIHGIEKNYWLNHLTNNNQFISVSGIGNRCNIEFISKSQLLRARGFKTDESLVP